MDGFSQFWFDVSLQGVAFIEPIHGESIRPVFHYRLVNTAFTKILSQTQDQLFAQPLTSLFPGEEDPDFISQLWAVVQTGESRQFHVQGLRSEDTLWLHVTVTRMDTQLMLTIQDITEQKKSEYDLQRRLLMESVLSTISGRLIVAGLREVDACVTEALEQVSIHIGAERASIFMYSDDYLRGNCTHEWCAPGIDSKKETNKNIPITAFAWLHRQLENGRVIRLEADNLPVRAVQERDIIKAMGIRSMICFPLMEEYRTQGFIAFYTIHKVQSWEHNDISLLETFSTIIDSVFRRLKQETAIRRANQRLEGLHEIDQALLSYRLADKSPLLIGLKYIHFMVPCEQIMVFHIDESTKLAVAKCRVDEGVPIMKPRLVITDSSFYEQFLSTNQSVYIPVLQPDTAGVSPQLKLYTSGFRSFVVIPLFSQQECIGVFTLAARTPYFFTKEHLQVAEELASQLAIVLNQQQLDEQVESNTEQLEQRVEERTREVRRLSTVHQAILEHAGQAILSTDTDGVIQTANQACENLLGYRIDELIGRVAHFEYETEERSVPVLSYRPAKPAEAAWNNILDALTDKGYFYAECLLTRKDGNRVPILFASSVLTDEENTIIGYVGIATDISALKTVELKLQEKNQELNTIFEGAIDLHCVVNGDGRFLMVNQPWRIALGYQQDELDRLTFGELIHPEEQASFGQSLQALASHHRVRNQLSRFRKKDGTYLALEWNAIWVNNVFYASARDVTERQEKEVQLRGLNQRLQMATKAAGQGIWEVDLLEERLIWDDRCWEIHGVEPQAQSWSFQDYVKLIHPDDLPGFMQRYNDQADSDTIFNITRIVRPDGTIRYVKASGKIISNAQGKPVRHIGVLWDVTEQKLAEDELRESERRFREIADNVDEVFWIHSADPFELLYVNSAYERVWNFSPQHLYESPFSFLNAIVEEDRATVMEFLNEYRAGREGQIDCRQKGDDGAIRWLSIRTFIVHDESGRIVRHIGIANDVTSQKEKELLLQQSLQREQELNQLKSQFVSTASHEFRTPLATIQSSVDLISAYLDLPQPKASLSIRNHLGVIEKEIDQVSALLNNLLSISSIEAGRVNFNPRRTDIVATCKGIIATHFSQQSDHRSVDVSIEGKPYAVFLDDKLISHVIVNLLSNAFKFSKTNPTLRLLFRKNSFVFQVADKGIGIPARELSALFQAFFRASNSAGIPGTGLGLVIARQFVELHNGHLDIQSEEKKGTVCTVTLPIHQLNKLITSPVTNSVLLATPN